MDDDDAGEPPAELGAAAALRGKRTGLAGMPPEEDGNPGAINSKRKGSVFGALVGASSKKAKSSAGWREELDEEEDTQAGAASATANAARQSARASLALPDDSEEELIDPGTPLPSEDEEEQPPRLAEAAAAAAVAVAAADAAPALAEAVPATAAAAAAAAVAAEAAVASAAASTVASAVAAPEHDATAQAEAETAATAATPVKDATAVAGEAVSIEVPSAGVAVAAPNGTVVAGAPEEVDKAQEPSAKDASEPAASAAKQEDTAAVNGHAAPAKDDQRESSLDKYEDESLGSLPEGKRRGVVLSLEMVSGPEEDEEVSAPFEVLCWGSRAEVVERLAACLAPGAGAKVQALVRGAYCAFSDHPSASSACRTKKVACTDATLHKSAGLLSAPLAGPGLLMTFAPLPGLDESHRPIGLVLRGRHNLRRLDVLAPCCGGGEPAQPLHFRVVGVKRKIETDSTEPASVAVAIRPPISAGPAPVERPEGIRLDPVVVSTKLDPFAWEDSPGLPADELELIDLGLDMREAELNWLKGQTFSRERQTGLAAVQDALAEAQGDLERIKLPEADQALSQRLLWLQERARYLLRFAGKLQ